MREIKFRVWDDVLKEMLYSKAEQFDDAILFRFEKHLETENPIYMQYTGINNEYGTEIYEGDILKWSSPDNDGTMMVSNDVVIFKDGCFMLKNEDGRVIELLKEGIEYNESFEKVELIGNIYENPIMQKI